MENFQMKITNMEKFDEALDNAKRALAVTHIEWGSHVIIEHLIHAIDLLGDEVAKLKEKKNE